MTAIESKRALRQVEQQMLVRDMLVEAENERMDALLDAWNQEIESDFQRLEEEQREIEAQKDADAAREAQEQAAAFAEARQLDAFAQQVQGLVLQADSHMVSIPSPPSGMRAASLAFAGPPIEALLGQLESEDLENQIDPDNDGKIGTQADDIAAQKKDQSAAERAAQGQAVGLGQGQGLLGATSNKRPDNEVTQIDSAEMLSARWALGHGLLPHPGDLAAIMQKAQVDAPWKQQFLELSMALDRIPETGSGQLRGGTQGDAAYRAFLSTKQMDVLGRQVQLLGSYGSERLLRLVTNPSALAGSASPEIPSTVGRTGGMGTKDFNAMITTFQKPGSIVTR